MLNPYRGKLFFFDALIYSEHLTSQTLQAAFFLSSARQPYRRGGRPIRFSAQRVNLSPMVQLRLQRRLGVGASLPRIDSASMVHRAQARAAVW